MERKLKIQAHYRPNGKYDRTFHIIPKLILSGKWLQDAGFSPESEVQVTCQNGQLIISSIQ
ncbi:MAG: SymE family type I addiction module toxin [Mariniphaga sp.]